MSVRAVSRVHKTVEKTLRCGSEMVDPMANPRFYGMHAPPSSNTTYHHPGGVGLTPLLMQQKLVQPVPVQSYRLFIFVPGFRRSPAVSYPTGRQFTFRRRRYRRSSASSWTRARSGCGERHRRCGLACHLWTWSGRGTSRIVSVSTSALTRFRLVYSSTNLRNEYRMHTVPQTNVRAEWFDCCIQTIHVGCVPAEIVMRERRPLPLGLPRVRWDSRRIFSLL